MNRLLAFFLSGYSIAAICDHLDGRKKNECQKLETSCHLANAVSNTDSLFDDAYQVKVLKIFKAVEVYLVLNFS